MYSGIRVRAGENVGVPRELGTKIYMAEHAHQGQCHIRQHEARAKSIHVHVRLEGRALEGEPHNDTGTYITCIIEFQ